MSKATMYAACGGCRELREYPELKKEILSLQSKLTQMEALARDGWSEYEIINKDRENGSLSDRKIDEIDKIMNGAI